MFRKRLVTLLVLAMTCDAVGAANVVLTMVGGGNQFHASDSVSRYDPLTVMAMDESGAPVPGVAVRFSLNSPRGDVVAVDGKERLVTTDHLGKASWSDLVVTAGDGLFSVTAKLASTIERSVSFVLGRLTPQFSSGCPLPVAARQTRTTIRTMANPGAVNAPVEIIAEFTDIVSTPAVNVIDAYVGITSDGKVISSEKLTTSSGRSVSAMADLAPGVHILKAMLIPNCTYVGSASEDLYQSVASGAGPTGDFTDMWWKPSESGWGMSVIQHASGQLFVVWFHYRDDGSAQWMVIPGGVWTSPMNFMGTIYRTTGPALGGVFDPSRVSVMPVGVATVAFTDSNSGAFIWSIDGAQGVRSISRQPF